MGGGGGESKVGKNGEKGRERGTPCPTSNKLVIIFSQYLSWIGCYFIIFYCLLLLLLPVRKPPSASLLPPPPSILLSLRTVSLPPTRHPFCLPSTTAGIPHSVLLSRASLRTEGIHSRNSLLRGLFCCNRLLATRLYPFFLSLFSFFLFGQTRQTHCSACRLIVLQILMPSVLLRTWISKSLIYIKEK